MLDLEGVEVSATLSALIDNIGTNDPHVEGVRIGKYLEFKLAEASKESAAREVREMCEKLLANPVIEDYRFEIEEQL